MTLKVLTWFWFRSMNSYQKQLMHFIWTIILSGILQGMFLPSKSKSLGQYNTKSRHVWKKTSVWMGLSTDQISLKIIFRIVFVDFGRDISCSKSNFLSKAPTSRYKSVSQIFKILFHKLETVIFLSFVVSFIMPNIFK